MVLMKWLQLKKNSEEALQNYLDNQEPYRSDLPLEEALAALGDWHRPSDAQLRQLLRRLNADYLWRGDRTRRKVERSILYLKMLNIQSPTAPKELSICAINAVTTQNFGETIYSVLKALRVFICDISLGRTTVEPRAFCVVFNPLTKKKTQKNQWTPPNFMRARRKPMILLYLSLTAKQNFC
jgi:hypothetical protein